MALIPSLLLWLTVMPITLIWHRIRIERRLEAVNRLKMQILSE